MESPPTWPAQAIFPVTDLTEEEATIEPRAWWCSISDGYRVAVLSWPAVGESRGDVVILHGVQSHAGWYHGVGRRLAGLGYSVHFPDRRGSGANREARGHAGSARRLVDDVCEVLQAVRTGRQVADEGPVVLGGISWGGKLAVATAARAPRLVDGLALICPGLHPRVGVRRREKLGVAGALLTGRAAKRVFAIPLADPALFTDYVDGRRFIEADPLSIRVATAGLLYASRVLDGWVGRSPELIRQPSLLMLAGRDRIVNNARTLEVFERIAAVRKTVIEYPEAHHTLDFEPDPRRYVVDLAGWIGGEVASAVQARI